MKQFILILVIGTSFHCYANLETFSSLVAINKSAKNFKFSGKKIYTYFWATWCSVCKKKIQHHFPTLQLKNDEQFILIATDRQTRRVEKYLKKYKVRYPVFVDHYRQLLRKLEVKQVPAWGVWTKKMNGYALNQFSIGQLNFKN